jgi:hypothetical protein
VVAYLPEFEEDVFISYAHNDDDRYAGEESGWVTELHHNLRQRVRNYLGADVRLWRDIEIASHDDFANKIANRLAKTAMLLPVLSPSFLKREWPLRELELFVENAHREAGLLIDGEKSRIFKVEKMPVHRDVLPSVIQGTRSYQFYRPDPNQPNRTREFRPHLGGDYKQRYFEQMDELANDIATLLEQMAQKKEPKSPQIAVYLAETTSDLDDQAREIRREIKALGHVVLPTGDLPHRAKDYAAKVAANLAQAAMSVHLVGAEYGIVPEGEVTKSNIWIQHDLAMERGADPKFVRLIWMPPAFAPTDERQRKFIAYLHADERVQAGAEVLETKLDDLKVTLTDKLGDIRRERDAVPPAPASTQPAPSEHGSPAVAEPPSVYVICDQLDFGTPDLVALRKSLFAEQVEPVVLTAGESEASALAMHVENLELCDAFLIYYGGGSPRWFESKLRDFRKYLRGRVRPVLARAVYVASPETAEKLAVETNLATVIRGGSAFSPADLAPFLQRLRTPQPDQTAP